MDGDPSDGTVRGHSGFQCKNWVDIDHIKKARRRNILTVESYTIYISCYLHAEILNCFNYYEIEEKFLYNSSFKLTTQQILGGTAKFTLNTIFKYSNTFSKEASNLINIPSEIWRVNNINKLKEYAFYAWPSSSVTYNYCYYYYITANILSTLKVHFQLARKRSKKMYTEALVGDRGLNNHDCYHYNL